MSLIGQRSEGRMSFSRNSTVSALHPYDIDALLDVGSLTDDT